MGSLSTVSHVAAMFVCLIISALHFLRRVISRRSVLFLIYYINRKDPTRIVKLPAYQLLLPMSGKGKSNYIRDRLSRRRRAGEFSILLFKRQTIM